MPVPIPWDGYTVRRKDGGSEMAMGLVSMSSNCCSSKDLCGFEFRYLYPLLESGVIESLASLTGRK